MAGRVEAIYVTETSGALPGPIESVEAVAGGGLRGNRYFFADGDAPPGRALTLIAAEALEAFEAETGIPLTGAESRRNVVVRGIDVNGLVGKRFRVGEIECEGVELCEPCNGLAKLTERGVLRGLVHRGGLRADIVSDGEIAVGDPVAAA
jgi:MOSC domain-containing protein YiiM